MELYLILLNLCKKYIFKLSKVYTAFQIAGSWNQFYGLKPEGFFVCLFVWEVE